MPTQPLFLRRPSLIATALLACTSIACQPGRSTTPASPAAAPPSATPAASSLQQVLETELAGFRARTGVHVKNLATGEEAGVRADQPFNSFSVIKLGILVRAFQLADAGTLNLDERVEVRRTDLRGGSGILYTFDPGLRVTLRDLLTQMIITSDNTGTDVMLARVGGLNALNTWLTDAGYTSTRMVQSTADFFRQVLEHKDAAYRALPAEDVFAYFTHPGIISPALMKMQSARGESLQRAAPMSEILSVAGLWNDNQAYWLGSMTARDTTRLLEAIEQGTLASPDSTRQMQRMLGEQREGRLRIPHYLAWPDYSVAHKTGDGPPVIANDVGIVYGPTGAVIISFFSAAVSEPYSEHEDRIGHLARAVVDYFDTKTGSAK